MTVQQDLQKAVAAAESAQGTYLVFVQSTQDQSAKNMYQTMADDMTRHVEQLKHRLHFLTEANPLNQSKAKRDRQIH